jgi:glycosyltransferase involved in cell wall biosynthesis
VISILVISRGFAPNFAIGAIRSTKLSKYLSQYASVTVLTSSKDSQIDPLLERDMQNIDRIIRFGSSSEENSIETSTETRKNGTKARSKRLLQSGFTSIFGPVLFEYTRKMWKDYQFYSMGEKALSEVDAQVFDVVISTYSPKSTHKIARKYKKLYPQTFWIADFRDPVYRAFDTPFLMKWAAKTFPRRVCKQADVITAVSKGCLDSLNFDNHPNRVVVTNGFDRDDVLDIAYRDNDKFTLSYMGRIYPAKQSLVPLFAAIKELITENLIDRRKVCFQYAGPSKSDFLLQVAPFKLDDIINATDSVNRRESLKREVESHVLVLCSWNNKGEEGVVTGKLLEYMMVRKPVVALVQGTLCNSVVKEMIDDGNLGFCYEEASKDIDTPLLKKFLMEQYTMFVSGKTDTFSPNMEYVERYNYDTITSQIVQLLPERLREEISRNGVGKVDCIRTIEYV